MLSVVVPTRNERENVTLLCERVERAMRGHEFEVVFVDDSTDDTPRELAELVGRLPYVRFEHREGGTGLSSAVVRGYDLARGEVVAVMDADLQHPPELLLPMYLLVREGADVVVASRFVPGGDDGGLNAFRKLVSWTARKLGQLMVRNLREVSDPTAGFFAFDRKILEGAQITTLGWKILIEMLGVCHYSRVAEVPMRFADRTHGSSKLSAKPTLEYLEQLASLRGRAVKNAVVVERVSPERVAAMEGGTVG